MNRLNSVLKPLTLSSMLLSTAIASSFSAQAGDWVVGSGMYDITGPAADRGMVGYGDTAQTTQGIFTRLWSRAFTIGAAGTDDFVVFVSADLQGIPQSVHQGVMAKISADSSLSPYLNEKNVMLTATHTHVGPGGYDHTVLLNLSALGYDEDNYATIVDGIYQSIASAFASKASGDIKFAQGKLTNASINRNKDVYAFNADKDDYSTDVNDTMTVLKLVKDDGSEVGMINWFAVHNVSSPQTYRYISGDNKGMASQLFEKSKGTQPPLNIGFVAAFANSDEGDVSPNVCGAQDGCMDTTKEDVILSATKQYEMAVSLYDNSTSSLAGALNYRFQYVKMPGYQVRGDFTQSGNTQALCHGTVGWSFTAGAGWDGPSNMEGISEGMTQDNEGTYWNENDTLIGNVLAGYPLLGLLDAFSNISTGDDEHEACQYPKPTFVNADLTDDIALYTDTLPFQLFQIGDLALVGIPGEMTTMSGRRVRSDVLAALEGSGVKHVVIAGLANAYSGYITTNEEYDQQYYEGGHTVFGPDSLAAYRQIFTGLANSIAQGSGVSEGPTPINRENDQLIYSIGVAYDDKRLWESFGQTTKDASSSYHRGDTVSVKFRSGHPQNNFKTMEAFFEVQRKVNGQWETQLTENDASTLFVWIRDTDADCMACSDAKLEWVIDNDMPTGTYRIRHHGYWKSGWSGSLNSYSGKSSSFEVK
ncbi:neutral/alkaline non-lysosomal ceramidase N-terminal domain-containing protein [uncultured Shewanella sp.]|uniref:neutral/alkaline non-lysosomal ceramidase N-terminal domain-containing protein n=1 Tax=uncultured Shewanella sp. TaxID=173975 RepID=UPI00260D7A7E|nr:neutral/alkaline non-lysosomal ceramidase N-terminal domain-containing protein [uncultured Shewanella sp.]